MSSPIFTFAHIGINCQTELEARKTADILQNAFCGDVRNGSSSVFVGSEIEITKSPFPGIHGHLAFATPDIDEAIRTLREKGIPIVEGSQKYKDGKLVAVYLDIEIAGFAVHLLATS